MKTPTQLRSLLDAYLGEVRAISYREVRARQQAPRGSIGYGAGGIAYLLWYLGTRRRDRALLVDARRWLDSLARARGRDAFFADFVKPEYVERSIVDGRPGLQFLGALIGHGLDDARARDRHLDAFVAIARRKGRPPELNHGDAGFLTATLWLEHHVGDDRLAPLADTLAERLLATEWNRHGFAHGSVGMLHALVEWVGARGGRAPARLRAKLAAIPRSLGPVAPSFVPTWCNGAAGHVLLWAGAYRKLGDPVYLERAEEASSWMLQTVERPLGSLCCGHGGIAYALRALDHAKPSAAVRSQATERAVRAVTEMSSPWANGLMHGFAGVACLAEDTIAGPGGGFPLISVA